MKKVTEIDPRWSDYDKDVANCQLAHFGSIILDEYGRPIDEDYLEPGDYDVEREEYV